MWPTSDICSIFCGGNSPEGAWPMEHGRLQACRSRGEKWRTRVQARPRPASGGGTGASIYWVLCAGRDTSFSQEYTGSACALTPTPRSTSKPHTDRCGSSPLKTSRLALAPLPLHQSPSLLSPRPHSCRSLRLRRRPCPSVPLRRPF